MQGTVFSKNDLYPFSGMSIPTTSQTIAEDDEREFYNDNTTSVKGQKVVVNKNMIWGSLVMMFVILVVLHFIK
jgi:hypothetical protein